VGDDHFSRWPIARPLQRPTRESLRAGPAHGDLADRCRTTRPRCSLLGLAPDGACLARLVAQPAGELLPHRFTLTARVAPCGGLLSVALSRALRPVGVTHHRVLRSPDFPLAGDGYTTKRAVTRSAPNVFSRRSLFTTRLRAVLATCRAARTRIRAPRGCPACPGTRRGRPGSRAVRRR
jgi:hypothetical protein